MERTTKIGTILVLVVAFCFVLFSLAQATDTDEGKRWAKKNLKNQKKAVSIPIWQITQDGTAASVHWVDYAPNPRFAIYDPGTPGDETDDVVLDKETGLVWERSPSTPTVDWYSAIDGCYCKYLGGRNGWRLPTIEELASLIDPTQGPPTLPNGHPFINAQSSLYWSSTTTAADASLAWTVYVTNACLDPYGKSTTAYRVWCVRGGQGHDAY